MPASSSSPVTSGPTGLAAFDCTPLGTTRSDEGVNYTQQCFTQYQAGGDDFYDPDQTVENVGGSYLAYSFDECINTCDGYNLNRTTGMLPCEAVTYYANLTAPVDLFSGNCFLKTGRGVAYTGDSWADYVSLPCLTCRTRSLTDFIQPHTASAYWSCLDETTCIQ